MLYNYYCWKSMISWKKKIDLSLTGFILRRLNYQRIHIVGAARSGTTMLHYAMAAFKNVILFDRETSPFNHPGLWEVPGLFVERLKSRGQCFFITKRNSRWYEQSFLEKILFMAQKHDVKIINLIRDPRDVLSSYHPLHKGEFYVSPDKWASSVEAGKYLAENLNEQQFLQLCYEDIVRSPDKTFQKLSGFTGLTYRDSVSDWSKLKSNLNQAKVGGNMVKFMHQLRDFDKRTIGNWQTDTVKVEYINKLLASPDYGALIKTFMARYNYLSGQGHE